MPNDAYYHVYKFLDLNDWLNLALTSKLLKVNRQRVSLLVKEHFLRMLHLRMSVKEDILLQAITSRLWVRDVRICGSGFFSWAFQNSFGTWEGDLDILIQPYSSSDIDEIVHHLSGLKPNFLLIVTNNLGHAPVATNLKVCRSAHANSQILNIVFNNNVSSDKNWVDHVEFMSGLNRNLSLQLINPFTYGLRCVTPNRVLFEPATEQNSLDEGRLVQ